MSVDNVDAAHVAVRDPQRGVEREPRRYREVDGHEWPSVGAKDRLGDDQDRRSGTSNHTLGGRAEKPATHRRDTVTTEYDELRLVLPRGSKDFRGCLAPHRRRDDVE
jgi:hypothetical protein